MGNLKVLLKYFVKYKWHLLSGTLFVFLANYFRVLQPQMIREALDVVLQNVNKYHEATVPEIKTQIFDSVAKSVLKFALLVLGLAVLMGVFMYFMRQTIIVMSRLIEYDMHKEMFQHYQSLSTSFFKRNNTGDLMARITEDVSRVRMAIGPAILYGINLVSTFILVIFSMLKVSPKLTLYCLLPLPVLSFIIYYVSNLINKKSEVIQQNLAILNSTAQETYSGIRVVKSFAQENQMSNLFDHQTSEYRTKSLELIKVESYFFPSMAFLIGLSTILTVYVGGLEVIKGNITAGNIAEFVIYVNMLTWPVTAIGWIASLVQRASASQKRINDFMNEKPEIINQIVDPVSFKGEIVFDKVSFEYPVTGIKALKEISFKIKPGERIAIVGKTGCGKSTIAELLLRMYDITSGQISIDGKPLQQLDLTNLRRRIGYVPQDGFLFSDSVANNIAYGSDSSIERIEQFAKNTAIHEEIMSLPEQYQTIVGERGVTLSGGQKQRISIARALIKDPDIIVLDDCLSAVDAETEQRILEYLNEHLQDKTTIVITHRISTLMTYDNILVLKDGVIVEQGKHDELISQNGLYKEMFERQNVEINNL
jgi:ATP-binding cassette subfamily B multidrug efflux pump